MSFNEESGGSPNAPDSTVAAPTSTAPPDPGTSERSAREQPANDAAVPPGRDPKQVSLPGLDGPYAATGSGGSAEGDGASRRRRRPNARCANGHALRGFFADDCPPDTVCPKCGAEYDPTRTREAVERVEAERERAPRALAAVTPITSRPSGWASFKRALSAFFDADMTTKRMDLGGPPIQGLLAMTAGPFIAQRMAAQGVDVSAVAVRVGPRDQAREVNALDMLLKSVSRCVAGVTPGSDKLSHPLAGEASVALVAVAALGSAMRQGAGTKDKPFVLDMTSEPEARPAGQTA